MELQLNTTEVVKFLLNSGGKCTNRDLVSNFQGILNDPMYRAEARLAFKDIVNRVAVVEEKQGVKYIKLKNEYYPIPTSPEQDYPDAHDQPPEPSPTYTSPYSQEYQPYWRYRLSTNVRQIPATPEELSRLQDYPTELSKPPCDYEAQHTPYEHYHSDMIQYDRNSPQREGSRASYNASPVYQSHSNLDYAAHSYSPTYNSLSRRHSDYFVQDDNPQEVGRRSYLTHKSDYPQAADYNRRTIPPHNEYDYIVQREDDIRRSSMTSLPTSNTDYDDQLHQDVYRNQFDAAPQKAPSVPARRKSAAENFSRKPSREAIPRHSQFQEAEEVSVPINSPPLLVNQDEINEQSFRVRLEAEDGSLNFVPVESHRVVKHEGKSKQESEHRRIQDVKEKENIPICVKEENESVKESQPERPERPPRRSFTEEISPSYGKVKDRVQHIDDLEKRRVTKRSLSPVNVLTRIDSTIEKVVHQLEEDSGSVTVLDSKLKRQWFVTAARSDYCGLVGLLKKEPKLAAIKDIASGYTALHWAAKHGDANIVKLIAGTYKVNPNIRSNGGYTSMHVAALYKHKPIVHLLIHTYGGNSAIRDYSGKRADQYPDGHLNSIAGVKKTERRPLRSKTDAAFCENPLTSVTDKAHTGVTAVKARHRSSFRMVLHGSLRKKGKFKLKHV